MTGGSGDAGRDGPLDEQVEQQAADWIVRLSDPALSPAERASLRAERDDWLAAAAERRRAYEDLDRSWRLLREAALAAGTLARPGSPQAPERRAADPRVADPRVADPRVAGRRARPRRLVAAVAAAALLCLLAGLLRFYGGDPLLALEADFRVRPGETREVTLADGSHVTLGSGAAIAVEIDELRRRVRLLAGEAAFAVEDDTRGRPFVVAAGPLEAEALGTRFQVSREAEASRVTVIEHLVRVVRDTGEVGSTAEEPVLLGPGERLTLDTRTGVELLEPVVLARETAWLEGRLVFDREPLSAVVAELNRYRAGEILIADPALAGREVSGVFRLSDLDGAASRIARELGARQIELPPFVSLLY